MDLGKEYAFADLPSVIVYHNKQSIMARHERMLLKSNNSKSFVCPEADIVFSNGNDKRRSMYHIFVSV